MPSDPKALLIIAAGLLSGLLLGFLFRNSDAERDHAARHGVDHWFMRILYAPIRSLPGVLLLVLALGLMLLVLWLPGHLLDVLPLGGDSFHMHKIALLAGTCIGWLLRYLVWRRHSKSF